MGRWALSSQCRIITTIVILSVLAVVAYPYHLGTSDSAKFRYGRHDSPAVSDAALSDNFASEHANVSRGLMKRAMVPACDVATAGVSVIRGCHLTNLMFQTQGQVMAQYGPAIVSKFTLAHTHDRTSHWARITASGRVDIDSVAPYLVGLDNVDGFRGTVRYPSVKISRNQDWTNSLYHQREPYWRNELGGERRHEATFATHDLVISHARAAGVIITLGSWDPKFMTSYIHGRALPEDQLPEVGLWSDIAFIELSRLGRFSNCDPQDLVEPNPPRPGKWRLPPKWILIPLVWGPNYALEIISHCLQSYGLAGIPTWQNRETFPIGSFCFNAILGTQHGESIARFLISHKYRFGSATAVSVTVFGSGTVSPDSGYELPSLLVYVLPIDQTSVSNHPRYRTSLAVIRQANADWAAGLGNDPRNAPWKLKPGY